MPRVITTYIFKEIGVPFLLGLLILTVTALLSKVVKLVDLIFSHGAGLFFVLEFVASAAPSFLIYTVPVAFLIAVLMASTRLSSDSEITALKAAGISLNALLRPVLFMAAIAFAADLTLTLYVFPWGNLNMKRLVFEAGKTALTSGIEEKTFYDRFLGATLYVDRINPETRTMEGIFISQQSGDGVNFFFAKSGAIAPSEDNSRVYLKLDDGASHRQNKGIGDYNIVEFKSYTLELGLTGVDPGRIQGRSNRELYAGELLEKARELKLRGENPAPVIIDAHKRFALPVSIFVFSLLGVPLGLQKVRSSRFTGFGVALGVVLLYYIASTAFETLGENGRLNPVLAVWGSNIIFGVSGAVVFYSAFKDVSLTQAMKRAVKTLSRGGRT
ncbi:MAG: LPS export ABC transporter permease LptF [Deltaproteobacteria bacterium]|nr:LPS export ABC transporter permease LptF [Deltaproteobacteria bacterium]